ncbi:MAG TPA: hypothetical protein VH761_06420 [Ilumatobacteraceae bacterium]|jgi:hypothetical protein
MKSLVILPGRAPQWVAAHARHLAQELTASGRVMVVLTHDARSSAALPGQPNSGSVLGHSTTGYPIWPGRLSAALGLRRRSRVTIIVLWTGANDALALWAGLVARLRRERLVLELTEVDDSRRSWPRRILRRVLCLLAHDVVEGAARPSDAGGPRTVLVLCGDDVQFARLALQTFEGMSDATASRWCLLLQVNEDIREVNYGGSRRAGKVIILGGAPSPELLRSSDVLVAAYGREFEDCVHKAVLSGGAGVLVGQPAAGTVARCHDGVWLAKWNSASILVTLEASSGDLFERPGPVARMRALADDVIRVAEGACAA